jgi:hypothetical protein
VDEHDDSLSEPDPAAHQPIPVELHSVYESGPFTRCTICGGNLHSALCGNHGSAGLIVPADHERLHVPPLKADGGLHRVADDGGLHRVADNAGLHRVADNAHAVYEIQKVFRGPEVLFEMAICRRCGEQVAKEFSEESIEAMKGFLLSNFKPDKEASHCHFCAFPLALLTGWTMVGACMEDRLVFPPIILCEPCSENLQQRLSKKTRDVQDEFIRDHFPGVPADLDFSPSVFGV